MWRLCSFRPGSILGGLENRKLAKAKYHQHAFDSKLHRKRWLLAIAHQIVKESPQIILSQQSFQHIGLSCSHLIFEDG